MDYHLSTKNKTIIEKWKLTNDKMLFISGKNGCGKTSLGKELLKDNSLIHITTDMIKKKSNIGEYIENIIHRKSIQMMFKNGSTTKSILLDDLDVFYKLDKPNFHTIIRLLKTKIKNKIIIIFHSNIGKNKYIQSILKNNYHIILDYSQQQLITIVTELLKQRSIKYNYNDILRIVDKSQHNINTILSMINGEFINQDTCDKNYTSEDILELFTNKNMNLHDISRLYYTDYSIFSLNLIENIALQTIANTDLICIYESYCHMDIMDTFIICNHIWELSDYSIMFSLGYAYTVLQQYTCTISTILYNKYISKSLISIHSNKIFNNHTYYPIYLYFMNMIYNNQFDSKDISMKYIDIHIKPFNWLYGQKITKHAILQLING